MQNMFCEVLILNTQPVVGFETMTVPLSGRLLNKLELWFIL